MMRCKLLSCDLQVGSKDVVLFGFIEKYQFLMLENQKESCTHVHHVYHVSIVLLRLMLDLVPLPKTVCYKMDCMKYFWCWGCLMYVVYKHYLESFETATTFIEILPLKVIIKDRYKWFQHSFA